jgi:transposase-like protein
VTCLKEPVQLRREQSTEEQIIGILKEAEQTGNIREVCRLHNLTEQTLYRWLVQIVDFNP